ncbi:MAG: ABC transporter ATP-binding protein [candidate division NC10 bacterium]|nr:ABC transporter ATP-binding protein [candidate division NC10 bacterium]
MRGVDLHVDEGELFGLIGPNGSGKTTFFNCVTGSLKCSAGKVAFKGREITNAAPDAIYRMGIGRTFQLIELFPGMTVLENMLLALQERQGSMLGRLFRIREEANERQALELLEFLRIAHVQEELALLDFGMVMMSKPDLILLDEPTCGVEIEMREQMMHHIKELNKQGTTIIVIEHNMDVVMNLCTRIVVLDTGEKIAEGSPREIQNNQKVIDAYFGAEE